MYAVACNINSDSEQHHYTLGSHDLALAQRASPPYVPQIVGRIDALVSPFESRLFTVRG